MKRKSMPLYNKLVRFLKSRCPPDLPVKVRRVKLGFSIDGFCDFKEDHFLIRINRTLKEHEAIETLVHEWSHTLAWNPDKDEHCDEWGKAYSRVYRIFEKEFLD